MYERIDNSITIPNKKIRETDKKVLDDIVERISNVGGETSYKELTAIRKDIIKNKNKLSKEDFETMNEGYKFAKQVWKNLYNERKAQEEFDKIVRLATKQDDSWRRQVYKIEQMEQNILKARDKVKARQKWERAKERAIEQIGEEYGLDADAAYDKYQSFI